MDIIKLISASRQGQTVPLFGTHFELTQQQVEAVIGNVIPMLEDALTRLMASPQGLAAILAQLASGQYQRDKNAKDIFENSRILANGTGVLALLLHNEANIRTVSFVAAKASNIDGTLVRRMLPYIATFYMGVLAKRSNEPLQQLAERCTNIGPLHGQASGQGTYRLAELVLSKTSRKKTCTRKEKAWRINQGYPQHACQN